jgi:hypothetical protein
LKSIIKSKRPNFVFLGPDTPLPDLNMIVTDGDIANNAQYDLVLESVENAQEGVFTVYPTRAIGRTPVIIRVANPDRLDYEVEESRQFVLRVKAMQADTVLSSVLVTVLVRDANDNVPIFDQLRFDFSLREDAQSGESIGKIVAVDYDSGNFGQVEYTLRGFGADKFRVNSETGELFVNSCGGDVSTKGLKSLKSLNLTNVYPNNKNNNKKKNKKNKVKSKPLELCSRVKMVWIMVSGCKPMKL